MKSCRSETATWARLAIMTLRIWPVASFNGGGVVCFATLPLRRFMVSSGVLFSCETEGVITQQKWHRTKMPLSEQPGSRSARGLQTRYCLKMGAGPVPCEVQATCARVAARLFGRLRSRNLCDAPTAPILTLTCWSVPPAAAAIQHGRTCEKRRKPSVRPT